MDTTNLIKYTTVKELLNDIDYLPHIIKRVNKHTLKRTFFSIKWYTIDIIVETIKIDCNEIVIKIIIDGYECNGMDDFRRRINDINRIHKEKRKQTGK
jgi:Ribonuclease G/E